MDFGVLMPRELNENQKKVIAFIKSHSEEEGSVPSFKDIAKAVGFKNASGADYNIGRLIDMGYLIYRAGKKPAYKLANVKITIEDLPSD